VTSQEDRASEEDRASQEGRASQEDKARRADRELLGLRVAEGERAAVVELDEIHLAPSGRLYGGAGVALAAAAIEAAAGRRLAWVTAQFIGACGEGDRLEVRSDVVAAGRRVSQLQVRAYARGTLVFQALGAAGDTESGIPDGTIPSPPGVPPPADCPVLPAPASRRPGAGFFGTAEVDPAARAQPRAARVAGPGW
jgi:acyl-coenzyme A thioesterase PaaI-like protein